MTLVERLRTFADDCDKDGKIVAADLFREAVDFIERIDYAGTHTCHARCKRLPCVQQREIESLQRECALLRECKRMTRPWVFSETSIALWDEAEKLRDQREGGK